MAIYEHIKNFAGRPVVQWEPGDPISDPAGSLYRIGLDYDETMSWPEKFGELLQTERSGEITGLVVGPWAEVMSGTNSSPVIEAIVAARDWLRKLNVLFFGDIIMEESEISWITQSNMSPLIESFPLLEHLCIRGGTALSFGSPIRHAQLKTLIIQTGGLQAEAVRAVGSADLPALTHLELWLGEPNYGGDATAEDVAPILAGDRFTGLKYLGLKNSEIQDQIAIAVARSPLLDRLETLDLSMGTLTDEGANALLSGSLKKLRLLDIHHHFVSDAVVSKLKSATLAINAGDVQKPHEYRGELSRFVAVGE